MRTIPGACGELVLPDECFDKLFQVGDCLVETGVDAVTPFFAETAGTCEFVGFVSFASESQPDDVCDQLSVIVRDIRPNTQVARGCAGYWLVEYQLEAVFFGYPALEAIGDEKYVPSVAAQENATRWLLGVGIALNDALWAEITNPTCDAIRATTKRSMSGMKPSGPRGQCAGWKSTITLAV